MEQNASLNATHDRVTLAIERELDAAGLEHLIHELAELRARMNPSVPRTLEEAMATNTNVMQQSQPSITFRPLADGGLNIWLRNIGLGWLGFGIPSNHVQALIRELVPNNVGDPHRTH